MSATQSIGLLRLATSRSTLPVIAASAAMQDLFAFAARAAATDAAVLITGERGVGKAVLAEYIHQCSARANRRFVRVNCATFKEMMLTRELFGDPGQSPLAWEDRCGRLRRADGGTLFLDHAAKMTLGVQALLVRFIDNGVLSPIGDEYAPVHVSVRFVAATAVNLADRVAAGCFRLDLFHRLHVVEMSVPPLRERPDDIRPLLESMLEERHQGVRLADSAWSALRGYEWPGNIHELRNVLDWALARRASGLVERSDLPAHVLGEARSERPGPVAGMVADAN